MKIIFLSDDFPPKSFGGAGIVAHDLAQGLKRAGHDLYVVTAVEDKALAGWTEYGGLKVFNVYSDYPPQFAAYVSLHNPSAQRELRKVFDEVGPDIVHAHNIHHHLSYHSLKLARRYTDRVFLTAHDAMAFNYGKLADFYDKGDLSVQKRFSYKVGFLQNVKTARKRYNPFRNLIIRHYLNAYPQKVFAISDALRDALKENGIHNCQTLYSGIDCAAWPAHAGPPDVDPRAADFVARHSLAGKKVVFFGGRLSEQKGGRLMIEALAALSKAPNDMPDARLLIAGKADGYAEHLMRYSEELGVRDKAIFAGWLSREEMKLAYAASDVCATPSIYFDPFNLFNIEAAAAGKPVVGTCFGGTPEIVVDGETGRIVNPRNVPMLAGALAAILKDAAYARKLGQAGRERVRKHFDISRFVAETLEWYSKPFTTL